MPLSAIRFLSRHVYVVTIPALWNVMNEYVWTNSPGENVMEVFVSEQMLSYSDGVILDKRDKRTFLEYQFVSF